MSWQPIAGDSARRFVDTTTGETISRRQYDKTYGRLKDVPVSQDKIADFRKAAGVPKNVRGLVFTYGKHYDQKGRRHAVVTTKLSEIQSQLDQLKKIGKIQKDANVSARIKTKKGWKQTKVVHPHHHSDAAGALAAGIADLNDLYGEDDDTPDDDPNIELDWGYTG